MKCKMFVTMEVEVILVQFLIKQKIGMHHFEILIDIIISKSLHYHIFYYLLMNIMIETKFLNLVG